MPSSGASVAYGVTQADEAPPGSGAAADPVSARAPSSAFASVVEASTGPGLGRTIDPGESPAPPRAPRWPLAVGGLFATVAVVAAVTMARGPWSGASPSRPQVPSPLASASAPLEPSPSASTVATGATPDSTLATGAIPDGTVATGATPGSTATTAQGKPKASATAKPVAPTSQGKAGAVAGKTGAGHLTGKPLVTPAKPAPTAPSGAPNHL